VFEVTKLVEVTNEEVFDEEVANYVGLRERMKQVSRVTNYQEQKDEMTKYEVVKVANVANFVKMKMMKT
jgi:hypothetical protein